MNDQAELRIRFDPDTDGTGKLFAFARSSGFSGCGSAWFSIEGIGRFAQAMTHFPLRHDDLPELAGGFWSEERREYEQEHLGISVYSVGSRGQVGVQIRLATELWSHQRPESQHSVRLEILTTYQRLLQFSRELLEMVRGERGEAVLHGEELEGG